MTNSNLSSDTTKIPLTKPNFFRNIAGYFKVRTRQFIYFSFVLGIYLIDLILDVKTWSIRRMFWGRSSFYRTSFHLMISTITIIALISGVSSRLNIISANDTQGLDLTSGVIGRQDIFSQSGTAESISSVSEDEVDYRIFRHKVQEGETLSQISELYGISSNSIRWANQLTSDNIKVGQVVRIPEIDGAFVKVKSGDTLESIAARNSGNIADILDLNSNIIDYRNPVLTEGMEVFIPGGEIPLPTPTKKPYVYAYQPE
jgi:LysM repeat protein